MRNQKGLTLVEVLGSIVLLGIAILGITFILQQVSTYTKANENSDQSVVISRNVMEEIKVHLKTTKSELSIYSQTISLDNLRNSLFSTTLYYPDATKQQYEIRLESSPADLGTVPTAGVNTNLDDIFREITIVTKELATNKTFELTAYVEFR